MDIDFKQTNKRILLETFLIIRNTFSRMFEVRIQNYILSEILVQNYRQILYCLDW